MGRTNPTETMKVYQFEKTWSRFARAPRKATREAFRELAAFAHHRAAPRAHAGSPYGFEMIVLSMLVGVVRRAEALEAQGIPLSVDAKTSVLAMMSVLRQRLWKQKGEVYTFARALLSEEDERASRALVVATHDRAALVPRDGSEPTDERILTALVEIMQQIRMLEKRHMKPKAIVTLEAWSRV